MTFITVGYITCWVERIETISCQTDYLMVAIGLSGTAVLGKVEVAPPH